MSGITLKIDKGKSSAFSEIMGLLQSFPGLKECKKHYSVKLTEEDIFRFRNELERIMQLLPHLSEKEWFDIPAYGTDELSIGEVFYPYLFLKRKRFLPP